MNKSEIIIQLVLAVIGFVIKQATKTKQSFATEYKRIGTLMGGAVGSKMEPPKAVSAKSAPTQKPGIIGPSKPPESELAKRLRKEVQDFKAMGPYEIKDDPSIWKKGKNDV